MSDFGEKHTVARLVGAPPGYIGYNEGGELTSKIARKPQSVVLFDEIEKAHPEVMNILLQIMEEGQLSDMRGDTYDFSKAVIILTSNLGTDAIHKRDIGYGGGTKSDKAVEERVMQSVKTTIKPELLNRFDEIVTFRQLEKSDSIKILDLLLKEVYAKLAEKGISFTAGAKVKQVLLDKGFSTEFGARALRRTVEKELLDKIATFLLASGESEPSKKEDALDKSGNKGKLSKRVASSNKARLGKKGKLGNKDGSGKVGNLENKNESDKEGKSSEEDGFDKKPTTIYVEVVEGGLVVKS